MSNDKRVVGCLGYIGDEVLPSYMGVSKKNGKTPQIIHFDKVFH